MTDSHEPTFEYTGAVRQTPFGSEVHQIRALVDLPRASVRAGDLGGWVESITLRTGGPRVSGCAWVYADAVVSDDAQVGGSASLRGNAWAFGNATVSGGARVSGDAWLSGCSWVSGDAAIDEHTWISGEARVSGDARVSGHAWVSGRAWVSGNASVSGAAWVYGDSWVSGNARVSGAARIERRDHVLAVGPLGPEALSATLFRTRDDGHELVVGPWSGSLSTFMTMVEAQSSGWPRGDGLRRQWLEQFGALRVLAESVASGWAGRP